MISGIVQGIGIGPHIFLLLINKLITILVHYCGVMLGNVIENTKWPWKVSSRPINADCTFKDQPINIVFLHFTL